MNIEWNLMQNLMANRACNVRQLTQNTEPCIWRVYSVHEEMWDNGAKESTSCGHVSQGGSAGKELLQLLCLFFKRLLFCSVVSLAYICGFLLLSGIGRGDNLSGTLNYLLRELVCCGNRKHFICTSLALGDWRVWICWIISRHLVYIFKNAMNFCIHL